MNTCTPTPGISPPPRNTHQDTVVSRTHMLRLLPGDDLVSRLAAFVRDERLDTAVILTCVGSTGTTRIRPTE